MVYFIWNHDLQELKVGHSRSPELRISQIEGRIKKEARQRQRPNLELMFCVQGGVKLEKKLHGIGKKSRLHGEWFTLEILPSLASWCIREIAENGPDKEAAFEILWGIATKRIGDVYLPGKIMRRGDQCRDGVFYKRCFSRSESVTEHSITQADVEVFAEKIRKHPQAEKARKDLADL